jgi:hypothetical protein
MVLAMALWNSNQIDDARAAFAKGIDIEQTKLPRLDTDLGNDGVDWIIAHALMKEAKALIEGQSATVKE